MKSPNILYNSPKLMNSFIPKENLEILRYLE